MKISVVIPAFNSIATLERAMASVWNQTHKNFELIVMDAGSKDGSRELLEANSHRITYWRSEKDNGTTDAMNEGFKRATGDLVTFLCSDDQLHNEHVFKRVIEEFNRYPDTEVLCAGLEVVDPAHEVRTFRSYSRPDKLHRGMTVHLPGAFFKCSVFDSAPFKDSSEVANDYELFAYLQKVKGAKIRVMNEVTVTFSLGGRTNDPVTDFWKAHECFEIRRRYYSPAFAWLTYGGELGIAILRKMHFRPMKWGRKLRKAIVGN